MAAPGYECVRAAVVDDCRRGDRMNQRRDLVLSAALVPFASPLTVLAQTPPKMRRIGVLSGSQPDSEQAQIRRTMLRESLHRLGWDEGRNLVIEWRYYAGDPAKGDAMAEELVRLDLELIIASLTRAGVAARRATSTIPIVVLGVVLPVEMGLAQSLARPGGNFTGTVAQELATAEKLTQTLKELAPGLTRIAILAADSPTAQAFAAAHVRPARALGMTAQVITATRPDELDAALQRLVAIRAEGLILLNNPGFDTRMREIMEFAIRVRPGASSFMVCVSFSAVSSSWATVPVTLPPGRASDCARPVSTGRATPRMTIGIVLVARRAATPATVSEARISSTSSRTSSSAIASSLARSPPA
jgi:putative ABC transport system substrate-binding protein